MLKDAPGLAEPIAVRVLEAVSNTPPTEAKEHCSPMLTQTTLARLLCQRQSPTLHISYSYAQAGYDLRVLRPPITLHR